MTLLEDRIKYVAICTCSEHCHELLSLQKNSDPGMLYCQFIYSEQICGGWVK